MGTYVVDDSFIAEYKKLKSKVDTLRGGGACKVTNTPEAIVIVVDPPGTARKSVSDTPLFLTAKISASPTAINGGIRYTYPIKLGHWDMTSSPSTGGTWVDDSGGTAHTAFSEAEDMNTFTSGTGAIGTGNTNVTQSDGTINGGSCKLIPLNVGDYVSVKIRGVDSSGNVYYSIINKSNSAQ